MSHIFTKEIKKATFLLGLAVSTIIMSTQISTNKLYAATANTSTLSMKKGQSCNMNADVTVANNIKITLNGSPITIKDQIINQNGSILLPMREISNLLGALVDYDSTNKVAIIDSSDTHVEAPLGYSFLSINGTQTTIANNARSIVYNSKTYLPVRAVSQALSSNISYDSAIKTVAITTDGSIPTQSPSVTPTPQPTATPAPQAQNTPQYIFDNNLSMSTVDESYKKSFTSVSQTKQLIPDCSDKAADFVYKNMDYVEVNLAVTKQSYRIYGRGGKGGITFGKNSILISNTVSNELIVFKDGTYIINTADDFENGKTLEDVSYLAYSVDNTYVIVHITSVDTSSFKF